ncbi:MAG: hypothetical protein U5L04_01640 [Trueperaceae bacterium]|nr:hypothetical protein [Trueperaceae bacterium]
MAGDKLSLQEIQHRFAGQTVDELEQLDDSGNALSGDNGDPNSASSALADTGIDVTDSIYSGWVIDNTSANDGTFKIWVLWKGRTRWARIYDVTLEVAAGKVETEELKTRGFERVYFERTDGLGGSWGAYIEELK